MKRAVMVLVLMLFPLTANAGEKVSGTDFFVVDEQRWETGNGSGYWMWHGTGVTEVKEGPLPETSAIECHGAGFWDKDGSWGEGICIEGAGGDTRISHWKQEKGQDMGQWEYLRGTGTYAGITGGGTYKSQPLPGGRSISKWEGEVTFAQ
jgi:hypothetical protein